MMKSIKKGYALFMIIILLVMHSCKSQDMTLTSKKLYDIKVGLSNNPDSMRLQEKYISSFPSTAVDFENLFCNNQSILYGKEISYSMELMRLIEKNPNKIGKIFMDISLNFSKDYLDNYNLGGLRYATLYYILHYSDNFMLFFDKMQDSEQKKLIKYLADVENHKTHRYYQEIIDKYTVFNSKVAALFEEYRALRQKESH